MGWQPTENFTVIGRMRKVGFFCKCHTVELNWSCHGVKLFNNPHAEGYMCGNIMSEHKMYRLSESESHRGYIMHTECLWFLTGWTQITDKGICERIWPYEWIYMWMYVRRHLISTFHSFILLSFCFLLFFGCTFQIEILMVFSVVPIFRI